MILYVLAAVGALVLGVVCLVLAAVLLAAKWAGWEDSAVEEAWEEE